jgi:hypothetical protein
VGRTIALATVGGDAVLTVAGDSLRGVRAAGAPDSPAAAGFLVVDRGLGRVALRTAAGFVSVDTAGAASRVAVRSGEPGETETFQWIETPYGDLALLSLATHRYLRIDARGGAAAADAPGPAPDRSDGTTFRWSIASRRARHPSRSPSRATSRPTRSGNSKRSATVLAAPYTSVELPRSSG